MWSNIKKYVAFLCFFIGLFLVVYGLSVYLDGPKDDGISVLDCIYDIHKSTKIENKSLYYFSCDDYSINNQLYAYTTIAPRLVLERGIKVVKKNDNKTLYIHLINSTNSTKLIQWFNSNFKYQLANQEIVELKNNYSFKPNDNESYSVLVFTNNTTETEYNLFFDWYDVPSVDRDGFLEFLIQNFDVSWVKTAKIDKSDDGKTINVYSEKNSLSLRLNNEETRVILTIDGIRTDEFFVKNDNLNNLIVYPRIYVIEFLTIKKLDFSAVWSGLFTALFGGAMILLGSLFGNPIDEFIVKLYLACPVTKSAHSSNYMEYKKIWRRNHKGLWKWLLGVTTLVGFLAYIGILFDYRLEWLPLDIRFLAQDWIIRIVIFKWFISLLAILSWILFVEIAFPILGDAISLFLKKRGFADNIKMSEKILQMWYKELRSPVSLFVYFITGILVLNYMSPYNLRMMLFSFSPLVLLVSYKLIIASKKSYNVYGIDYITRLHNARVFVTKAAIIAIWVVIGFLLSWSYMIGILNNSIFNKTIGASAALTYIPTLSDTTIIDEALSFAELIISKEVIFSIMIILAFLEFCVIICINYLTILPSLRTQEAIRNIKEISIFLVAFTSLQIISAASEFNGLEIKKTLTTSFVLSILSYFFIFSYRQLISQKAEK